jgi:hypothetical protein
MLTQAVSNYLVQSVPLTDLDINASSLCRLVADGRQQTATVRRRKDLTPDLSSAHRRFHVGRIATATDSALADCMTRSNL